MILAPTEVLHLNCDGRDTTASHRGIPTPENDIIWRIRIQGGCTEVSRLLKHHQTVPSEHRGQVGAWSRESRMRLLREINKVDWQHVGKSVMATVTYPDECVSESYKVRSQHRYLLLRHLEKHLGRKVSTIWRQEWKIRKSGARVGQLVSHVHYLIPGLSSLCKYAWRGMWSSVLHRVGALCTDVTEIGDGDNGARYLAKYVSKSESLDISAYRNNGVQIGRHWGITRKRLLTYAPIKAMRRLTQDEIAWVQEYARVTFTSQTDAGEHGYTLLGEDAAKFFLCKFGQNVLTSGMEG